MPNNVSKTIRFPIKIGEENRIIPYSDSLTDGEEQLLVTRNGKLYLTNGKGGYIDFRSNDIYTRQELDVMLQDSGDSVNGVIAYVNSEIAEVREYALGMTKATESKIKKNTLLIEENKESIETSLDIFKSDTGTSILSIEESIKYILDNIKNSDIDIKDILKLIGNFELISEEIKDIDIVSVINNIHNQTILGKNLVADAINSKMPSLNASGNQSYLELSELIKEIKTGGLRGSTIEDFSDHTSLPSFSKHPKLKTFEAKE